MWKLLCCLLLALASVSSAFSDESLKDLGRLPHLQRHWLAQQHKQRKVTTPPALLFTHQDVDADTTGAAGPTSTTQVTPLLEKDDSLEVAEVAEDGRLLTEPNVFTTSAPDHSSSSSSLTVSLAKEKLRARRLKSRKRVKEESAEEQQQFHLNDGSKEDVAEIKKHIQLMAKATCSTPSVRLVHIRDHYTTANVRYLPECTWLHRCSDDTGCCRDESKTCSPANIQTVSLPFFALTLIGTELKRTVTRLNFDNHTSCECVGRNADLMPRTEPVVTDDEDDKSVAETDRKRHRSSAWRKKGSINHPIAVAMDRSSPGRQLHRHQQYHASFIDQQSLPTKKSIQHPRTGKLCRCPSHYSPVEGGGNRCTCQCPHHNQHHCSRLRRGLDTFSLRDRGCISQKNCAAPSCDYGTYITFIGRCPRREDQNESWLRLVS